MHASKQRRPQHTHTPEEETEAPPPATQVRLHLGEGDETCSPQACSGINLSMIVPVNTDAFQAPPPEQTGRKKAEKKAERGPGKETGKGGIKTSSLFKHNPDIPDIDR